MKNAVPSKLRAILLLSLLAILCLLPYVSARWFYQHGKQWFTHSVNYGTLIQPPPTLQSLKSPTWQLIYTQSNSCQQICMRNLTMLSQIRLALGRNAERISYGFLGTAKQAQVKDIQLPLTQQNLLGQLPQPLRDQAHTGYFIVDPHGNVILYYNAQTEPKPIYSDLKRLLKASRIG